MGFDLGGFLGGGGIAGSLFGGGGGGNPADAAKPFLEQARQDEKEYLDPFIQRGGRAGDLIEDEYGRMMQHPQDMLQGFMGGYEPSKFYQMMQDRLGQAASNTAAAGGMRGSPYEQGQQQELTQALLSKDMQQYLQNVMGIHGRGVAGEQGLYGTGFEGARSLASDLGNIAATEGQLAFQGEREKQQRSQDLLGMLGNLGGAALGGMGGQGGSGADMAKMAMMFI